MINGYRHLSIRGVNYSFLFNKVISPQGGKYFIVVSCDMEVLASFEMIQNENKDWKILPPVPSWIIENERLISAVIEGRTLH